MPLPEEHARGGRRVLDESAKVAPHRVVKEVPSFAVELRDGDSVRMECVVSPGGEHRVHDHLRQRRSLDIRDCSLGSGACINMGKRTTWMGMGMGLTCMSIALSSGEGPVAKPIRIPEDSILDMLSNRRTRPTSGCSSSSEKYDFGRGSSP